MQQSRIPNLLKRSSSSSALYESALITMFLLLQLLINISAKKLLINKLRHYLSYVIPGKKKKAEVKAKDTKALFVCVENIFQ